MFSVVARFEKDVQVTPMGYDAVFCEWHCGLLALLIDRSRGVCSSSHVIAHTVESPPSIGLTFLCVLHDSIECGACGASFQAQCFYPRSKD